MADAAPKKGILKIVGGGIFGLCTGAVAMYSHAIVDSVVKPAKPLANFVVNTDGLTVGIDNKASGQSGIWDFGDGTALESFDPNQPTLAHTYSKPGTYSVKLTVRNFLMEENDRSVAVDLSATTSTVATLMAGSPQLTDVKIAAIRDQQAPATFRITGKLANADSVVWKLGDKTEHIAAPNGEIDRYVTFEKEGHYPIVLTALSKTMKEPQMVIQTVDVGRPTRDTYEAQVSVTDAVSRVEKKARTERVMALIRDQNGPTKGFAKTITAGPDCFLTSAVVDKSIAALTKNVKVEVAKDQKSASVTGEWAVAADALGKHAGGADMAIPVQLTEEKRTATVARNLVSGVMNDQNQIIVALPTRQLGAVGVVRTISVDCGITRAAGGRSRIAFGTLDATGHWTSPAIALGASPMVIRAETQDNTLKLNFGSASGTPAIPSGPQPLKK